MKSLRIQMLLIAMLTRAVAAQNYPLPVQEGDPPAICRGCKSINAAGESNDGKPTPSYPNPPLRFVGRIIDSQATANIQHIGMRTLRAGIVRTAYASGRGAAPARVYAYIGLGTLGAYNLTTFLQTISAPMVPVTALKTGARFGGRSPFERVARPDGWFYPESSRTNWRVPLADSTERLKDFDYDDRGYVYVAYNLFGWGVVRDGGEIRGVQMTAVSQTFPEKVSPDAIVSVRVGDKYFVAVSESGDVRSGRHIYDVTDPAAPAPVSRTTGTAARQTVIKTWARDDGKQIVAVVAADGVLRIYPYAAYVQGKSPAQTLTSKSRFVSMAFDEKGVLWVVEVPSGTKGKTQIRRFGYDGGRVTDTAYTPFPEWFDPIKLHARGGYVAVVGKVKRGARNQASAYIFRVGSAELKPVDTKDYFLRYYSATPKGFAQPEGYTTNPQDIHLLTLGGKTYLMYMSYGLGDVYELVDGTAQPDETKPDPEPDPDEDPKPCPCADDKDPE